MSAAVIRKPRVGAGLISGFLVEVRKAVEANLRRTWAESTVRMVFDSRRKFVRPGAHNERGASVYRIIRQKVRSIRRYEVAQVRRRNAEFFRRLIAATEMFLDKLYAESEKFHVERDPAKAYARTMRKLRSRAGRRPDRHLKVVGGRG